MSIVFLNEQNFYEQTKVFVKKVVVPKKNEQWTKGNWSFEEMKKIWKKYPFLLNEQFYWINDPLKERFYWTKWWKMNDTLEYERNKFSFERLKKRTKWIVHEEWTSEMKKGALALKWNSCLDFKRLGGKICICSILFNYSYFWGKLYILHVLVQC